MNTQVLLDKLTRAVTFKFKEDQTAPGITISSLKNKSYYCSVVRYSGSFAKGKQVVCKAESDTLENALKGLASAFVIYTSASLDPIQELHKLVGSP